MKMIENYKIIGSFIKDMSSETPDTPTYISIRDKISKYNITVYDYSNFFSHQKAKPIYLY